MLESDPVDTLLAVRCQLGHKEAWEELVHRWQPRLWRFVSKMLSDRSTAEDALQSVWLKVVQSMGRLRQPEHLPAWLYRIARTTVADRLREQYRRGVAEPIDDVAGSNDANEHLAIAEAVEIGLDQLAGEEREVVVLYYLEELPIADVALICNVPEGTIKSRLYRARRIMRRTLNAEGVTQ